MKPAEGGDHCPAHTAINRAQAQRPVPGRALDCFGYSAYGYDTTRQTLLGFNGSRPDRVTRCYLLGNGRRAFSPSLMRFTSSDRMSPFAAGGLNSYAYCLGDPVNRRDPSGSVPVFESMRKSFRRHFTARPVASASSPRVRKLPDRIYSERNYYKHEYKGVEDVMNVVGSSDKVPRGYQLVGLHGTRSEESVRSLEAGLNVEFSGAGLMGRGLYFTQSVELAKHFAGPDGTVVGVYTKGLSRLVEGSDYSFFRKDVMVVYPKAYDKFIVRRDIILPMRFSAEYIRQPSNELYAGREWF
ncbi:RHS repeat-associated core domain-containing protein [Pantoea sp. Tr-811]|uniref:RHS repeat-associated core domain-containing protein n=1 Tax=Pantoea sp. Tr-811 TaxID=2608361 RepID=UPI00141E1D6B|nr:RHS repeat-associated core domain-containing protein [Pantoea sp. Tr-811]NIF26544.1 RHS repeat-associated core domain-containing protein [Pantoea sp. Tr-811]